MGETELGQGKGKVQWGLYNFKQGSQGRPHGEGRHFSKDLQDVRKLKIKKCRECIFQAEE